MNENEFCLIEIGRICIAFHLSFLSLFMKNPKYCLYLECRTYVIRDNLCVISLESFLKAVGYECSFIWPDIETYFTMIPRHRR